MFGELTPYIAPNSITVAVSGNNADLLTVNERINYSREAHSPESKLKPLRDSLKKFNKELGLIRCRKQSLEKEKALLFDSDLITSINKQDVNVSEIEKASVFVDKRYYDISKELFELGLREDELVAQVVGVQAELSTGARVETRNSSDIKLTIVSPEAGTATVSFSFLCTKASWSPVYDFRYKGPAEPLSLSFHAGIINSCGTDWNEVKVKLSTTDPTRLLTVPSGKGGGGVNYKQVEVMNSNVEYTIKYEQSIPSDGKSYLIDVTSYSLNAKFHYLLIPRADPFGFLMAKVGGWNAYNLLPGAVNVYNMGTFMGRTSLPSFSENDTLEIFLGKDRSIIARREEKIKKDENAILGNYTSEHSDITITFKNNFDAELNIVLIDAVPLIDEDEKLSLDNIGTALYDKEGGKITWTMRLDKGEQRVLSYSYTWKSPKNIKGGYAPRKKKFRTMSCPAF